MSSKIKSNFLLKAVTCNGLLIFLFAILQIGFKVKSAEVPGTSLSYSLLADTPIPPSHFYFSPAAKNSKPLSSVLLYADKESEDNEEDGKEKKKFGATLHYQPFLVNHLSCSGLVFNFENIVTTSLPTVPLYVLFHCWKSFPV